MAKFHEENTQPEIRHLARKLGRLLTKQPYRREYDGYLIVFDIDSGNYKLMGCKNVDGFSQEQREALGE